MDSAPKEAVVRQPEVTTAQGNERKLVNQVAANVRQLGHQDHIEADVTPQTVQTPVPQSPDLKIVNAEHLDEEPSILEDTKELLGSYVEEAARTVVGGSNAETGESRLPFRLNLKKFYQQHPDQQIVLVDQKKAA